MPGRILVRQTLCIGAVVCFALLVSASASAVSYDGQHAALIDGTGTYSRPIDTQSALAQQFFDQGLRLMYGYYIPEAIASFTEALQHDPENPMIYCGLALAMGPNPNSRYGGLRDDPKGNARAVIKIAVEKRSSARDRDRALIEAVFIRFDTERYPDMAARDSAYLAAMQKLFEAYPRDPDIGALYADAYMVTQPWQYWTSAGKAKPGTAVAARALESVMDRYPDHPGANHLYIHLIEAGPEPERALPAADRLEGLMPIAGHIVHMPSHIYVRTGQYDKAIATNERSIAADKKFLAAWGDHPFPRTGTYFLSARNHARHAVDFIRYAASVQGNYARAIIEARVELGMQSASAIRRGMGQRSVVTPWLMHKMFGKWEALRAETRTHKGLPYVDGIWFYVQGSADIAQGDLDGAQIALEKLQELQTNSEAKKVRSRFNPVSTLLQIAAFGLDGEIKQARGELSGAIGSFKQAQLRRPDTSLQISNFQVRSGLLNRRSIWKTGFRISSRQTGRSRCDIILVPHCWKQGARPRPRGCTEEIWPGTEATAGHCTACGSA